MKIVFYISSLETSGGAERALIGLANWFSKDNKVIIVAERGRRDSSAYPIESKVDYIDLQDNLPSFPIRQISLLMAIRRTIANIRPDIIVSFLALANTRLLASRVYNDYPVIVCERNDPRSDPSLDKHRKQRDKLYKYAHGIIVQTDEVKEYFTELGYKNIEVIPNFVNTIPFHEENRSKTFVTMGRLTNQKNQKWLIDAFIKSRLSEDGYKLVIYGNGELKNDLDSFINENRAYSYVKLCPAISNILEEINKAYCFVLPSLYEGMPNALMEAMSMGLPCISTDCPCGGPRSLIKNGENGVLIEVNNTNELIRAMYEMAGNKEFSKKIAGNAFKIRQSHSIESLSKKWMDSFFKAIKTKGV